MDSVYNITMSFSREETWLFCLTSAHGDSPRHSVDLVSPETGLGLFGDRCGDNARSQCPLVALNLNSQVTLGRFLDDLAMFQSTNYIHM